MKYIIFLLVFLSCKQKDNFDLQERGINLLGFLESISNKYEESSKKGIECYTKDFYGDKIDFYNFFKTNEPYTISFVVNEKAKQGCFDEIKQKIDPADFKKKRVENHENIHTEKIKVNYLHNGKEIQIEPSVSIITDPIILNGIEYKKTILINYNNDTLLYFNGAFFFQN